MATTPNYGFNLPNLNADEGVWGEKLNQNWTSVDQIIFDLTPGTAGVEEAPEDGQPYVRQDAGWLLGVTAAYSEGTYSKIGHTHNHAALTDVTPDQHHNQAHLLYGPDQSDVDTLVTPLVRHVLGVNAAGDFAPDYRAGWRGVWGPQTYEASDMVLDDGWLMIANKQTTDEAAPVTTGSPTYSLPDVPGFTEPTDPGLVASGNVYTTTVDGWITGLRVYIPVIGADLPYQADVYEIVDEGPPRVLRLLFTQGIPANSTGTGWIDLTLPADILTLVGARIAVILAASNTAGEVEVVQAPWVYEGQINVGNPPLGDWNNNNADTTVRINDLDDDGADQSTPLATVIAGDIIRFTSQLTGVSWNYVASGPGVPAAGVFAFPVVRGAGTGTINPQELCDVLILREGVGPATYDVLADHWLAGANDPTWATVQGVLNLTQEQDPPLNDSAYGADIQFQPGIISEDWDPMAHTGALITAGGGSGSGIAEAPTDGQVYGRNGLTASWVATFTKAEADARFTQFGHTHVEADITDLNAVPEAPADNNYYSRRNGAWEISADSLNQITAQSFDGTTFLSTRAAGDFSTILKDFDVLVPTSFKSKGPIRHLGLVATTSINPVNGNRYLLTASASQNLNFTLPAGIDADLGEHYVVEGNVVITNTGIATITIQEDGSPVSIMNIKGTQPTASGDKYTLTYIIHRTTGDVYETRYIWSA